MGVTRHGWGTHRDGRRAAEGLGRRRGAGRSAAAAVVGLLCLAPPGAADDLPDLSRPLDLDTLVGLALERNHGISQAGASILRATGGRTGARAAFLPKAYLSTDYNYSRSRFDQLTVDPNTGRFISQAQDVTDEVYSLALRGSQSLVDLPSWYQLQGSGHALNAARAGLRDVRVQTVLAVKRQYYALVRSRQLAQVSREDYDLRQEQLRRARSLFELGSVARTDVLQSQVNLATAERERIAAENAVEAERARLAVLLALPVDVPLEVEDPPPVEALPEPEPEGGLVRRAWEQRPDLAQSREALLAAGLSERSARWARYPSLDGSYYWSKQEDSLGDLLSDLDTNRRWGLALGLRVTLFDGWQTKGSIQQSIADRRSQEAALAQKRLEVSLEVREAMLEIKTASEGIRSARDGVALAEESVRLQKALYESGGGTLLEWSNAQVELTRARVALVDAEVNLRLARAALEKALGEGTD